MLRSANRSRVLRGDRTYLWSILASARATNQTAITEEEAHAVGVNAYLYFYSLISTDVTRLWSTNIEASKEPLKGPVRTFVSAAAYPPGNLKLVVRINFDTLYSFAWLDLTTEPVVVSSPNGTTAIADSGQPRPSP
jgi:hypothetical protein